MILYIEEVLLCALNQWRHGMMHFSRAVVVEVQEIGSNDKKMDPVGDDGRRLINHGSG